MSTITTRVAARAAAIVALLLTASLLGSPAHAATPRTSPDAGLFGASDPTYDGVVRQSYAILGLVAAGVDVPRASVEWLIDQQCPDGSFMAYRSGECTAPNTQTYTGPDTNSTAAAALALESVGRAARARSAAQWLTEVNNTDGGWPWMPGLDSDPVSTGMVLQALRSLQIGSADLAAGVRWVRGRVIGCATRDATVGGMPYAIGGAPDSLSSAETLLGVGAALSTVITVPRAAVPDFTCTASTSPRLLLARFVARGLIAGKGVLPGMVGGAGWNETARAVLGLSAAGVGGRASSVAVARLARHVDDYAGTGDAIKPAALGTLLMVARAAGASPRAFGPQDIDLVRLLLGTRRR